MVIISKTILKEFGDKHSGSVEALNKWCQEIKLSDWNNLNDVKQSFNTVDYVRNDRYVFNIKGKKYRMVVIIFFSIRTIYIRLIGTHNQYDKIDCKMKLLKIETMESEKINNRTEYDEVMSRVEALIQKSTTDGFDSLSKEEVSILQTLSQNAERYEDSIPLTPIKAPITLTDMIRFKMFEMNLRQKQLASLLEISEARISEILSGKRKVNIAIAKKLHSKLNIDANFILEVA